MLPWSISSLFISWILGLTWLIKMVAFHRLGEHTLFMPFLMSVSERKTCLQETYTIEELGVEIYFKKICQQKSLSNQGWQDTLVKVVSGAAQLVMPMNDFLVLKGYFVLAVNEEPEHLRKFHS